MKFGICTHPSNAPLLAQMGFDYIEGAISALYAMEEAEYQSILQTVLDSPIRMEAANVFLPGTFQITGEQADLSGIPAYLDIALARAAKLGCKVAVFGSSGARNVPEGFPKDKAMEQLVQFLRIAGPACRQHGIRLAIEPLNTTESNIINSVKEGLTLAIASGDDNVGVLADFYHMELESEGMAGVRAAGELLWHCHIANPDGRIYPKQGDGKAGRYEEFFTALRDIGYAGRISIEGRGEPADDGPEGLRVLRG